MSYDREYFRARYADLKERGLCRRCMGPSPDHTQCEACRQRERERKARNLEAAGIVPKCKGGPDRRRMNGRKPTGQPRSTNAEQSRQRYHERVKAGLCVRCGRPSDGHSRCGHCRHRVYVADAARVDRITEPVPTAVEQKVAQLTAEQIVRAQLPEGVETERPIDIVCVSLDGRVLTSRCFFPQEAVRLWKRAKDALARGDFARVSLVQGPKVFLTVKKFTRVPLTIVRPAA